jgi:DNA-binding response OmpR family regulator
MARILVVDDLPDSLLAARAALTAAGHRCVLAADGEHALWHLAAGGFDLVVLDPALPLHDGWPVLAAVGAVPVVAVTGAAFPPGRAAATLAKPCPAGDLVGAVEAVLGRSG